MQFDTPTPTFIMNKFLLLTALDRKLEISRIFFAEIRWFSQPMVLMLEAIIEGATSVHEKLLVEWFRLYLFQNR